MISALNLIFRAETQGRRESNLKFFRVLFFVSVTRCLCGGGCEVTLSQKAVSQPARNLQQCQRQCCRTVFQRHRSRFRFPRTAIVPGVQLVREGIPEAQRICRAQVCDRRKCPDVWNSWGASRRDRMARWSARSIERVRSDRWQSSRRWD